MLAPVPVANVAFFPAADVGEVCAESALTPPPFEELGAAGIYKDSIGYSGD